MSATSLLLYLAKANHDDAVAFVDRVFARRVISAQQWVARCCTALLSQDLLDELLATLLRLMLKFFLHPQMQRAREDPDVPMIFLAAAQRQVCSGDDEQVWGILQLVFGHIGFVSISAIFRDLCLICCLVLC
jgi:hypothetical protein